MTTAPQAGGVTKDAAGSSSGACVLALKCRLEEAGVSETRLLLLRRAHLDELHCKLGWLFNLSGRYQLQYLDKFGDLITFSTDEEFQLALNNFYPPEFRILIKPAGDQPASRRPSARRPWTGRPGPPAPAAAEPDLPIPDGARSRKTRELAVPASAASAAAVPDCRMTALSDDASSVSAVQGARNGRVRVPGATPKATAEQPTVAQRDRRRAIFQPDYLRPRTALQRKSQSAATAAPSTAVQASLAGYRQQQLEAGSGADFVHFGIECSHCGADPLIGWRFTCSLCPNYNLCAACFRTYSHGHGFYRLP